MNRSIHRSVGVFVSGLLLGSFPASALAADWGLKLEAGMAMPTENPQAQLYGPGLGASLKGLVGVSRYLDIQAGLTLLTLPARDTGADTGVGLGLGAGLRLKRPRDLKSAVSPWIDGNLMYVRTGPYDRFGYDVGAGVAFAIDEERQWWGGPFIRYTQVVQPDDPGRDNTDAKILILGISLEVGGAHPMPLTATPQLECRTPLGAVVARGDRDGDGIPDDEDKCPDQPGPKSTGGCPDRDGDGLADIVDLCPDVPGPIANRGCPYYKKVVIRDKKLELTEKILFAFDKDIIESESWPLLDEVVRVLNDNKSFRVLIEGHTDSSGGDAHNQTLSEGRSRAVLAYLTQHGIAADRLDSKGYASSQPLQTNDTVVGREANRRVEFMIELKILNDGSNK